MHGTVLFDLDMTLVDSSALLELRSNRQWNEVYKNIPKTKLFPGVQRIIDQLSLYYNVGIVTSSPRKYAEKLIAYHKLNLPVLTAYHDTSNHKPSPDPIIFACEKLKCGVDNEFICYVGDEVNDIIAANNSPGVYSVGVSWGLSTTSDLKNAGVAKIIYSFDDFIEVVFHGYHFCYNDLLEENSEIQNIEKYYYIINYFPKHSNYFDNYSQAILKFKNGESPYVSKWAALARERVQHFDYKFDYIIRVLSSNETYCLDNHPLSQVCKQIGEATHANFYTLALEKKSPTRQLKYLKVDDKRCEIENEYIFRISEYNRVPPLSRILLVDDILTTGTTASVIAKKIKSKLPDSKIYLFTLGKTSNPDFGGPSDNSHMEEDGVYID